MQQMTTAQALETARNIIQKQFNLETQISSALINSFHEGVQWALEAMDLGLKTLQYNAANRSTHKICMCCRGSGKVKVPQQHHYGYDEVECRACAGTGVSPVF